MEGEECFGGERMSQKKPGSPSPVNSDDDGVLADRALSEFTGEGAGG